jgi:thiol-disulfide isomerase/thioredoxin
MNTPLDPWLHAEELVRRLKRSGSRLIVVIGAEAWCRKCQKLRPIFDAQAEQAPNNEIWLWLDMEEHAEFIGAYLPPDLPMLICYEKSSIVNLQNVAPDVSALEHALTHPVTDATQQDPGILARLIEENWAN